MVNTCMANSASRPDIDCRTFIRYGVFWCGMQHECGKDLPTSVAYAHSQAGDDPEGTGKSSALQGFGNHIVQD